MASPVITQTVTCGSVTNSASTGSFAFSDVATQIICVVAQSALIPGPPGNLSISDTLGLTWVARSNENIGNVGGFGAEQAYFVWTAETGGAVTTDITISNGDTGGKTAVCFGVKGLSSPSSPIDPAGIAKHFATSGAPTLPSFSTVNANDLITAFAMAITEPGATLSPGGYTNFSTVDEGDGFLVERAFSRSVSSPQTGISVTSPNASLGYMVVVPFTADAPIPPPSPGIDVSQITLLAPYSGPDDSSLSLEASVMAALVTYAPMATRYARASQMLALVPYSAVGQPEDIDRVSQMLSLVVWGGDSAVEGRSRAWAFVMDGHPMYVLDLGEEGTFIFDLITRQWCNFRTGGHVGWNMKNGCVWQETNRILGGDAQYPYVWEMKPDEPIDEGFRPVEHVVTGGVPLRSRVYVGCESLRLAASSGSIMGDSGATMTMKFSDDNGKTWSADYVIDLVANAFSQELAWNSLGSFAAPGRIFEISDSGGLIRIDGADLFLNNFDADSFGDQGGKQGGDGNDQQS